MAGAAIIDSVAAGYVPVGEVYSADFAAIQQREQGYFVMSGMAVTANASALSSVSRTTGNNTFDKTAHGLVAGDSITFTGLANTTGVSNGVVYYVVATGLTANAFRVATTAGGTALPLGGTTDSSITATQVGKVDVASGRLMTSAGLYECNYTAAAAPLATTITTLASGLSAGQALWVLVEASYSAGAITINFTSGSAAAVGATGGPVKPQPTAARIPLAWIYVPFGATTVDATTSSGPTSPYVAKLIDARQLVNNRATRVYATDTANTSLTNPTTALPNAGSSLLAATVSIPANSLGVGDVFDITAAGFYTNLSTGTNASIAFSFYLGTQDLIAFVSETLNKAVSDPNQRRWRLKMRLVIQAIGSGTSASTRHGTDIDISAFANGIASPKTFGGGAAGSGAVWGASHPTGFDSTAATTFDLQVKQGASSTGSTIGLREFIITKTPGP